MIVKSFPVGLLQCNCTILGCPKTKEAVVVDPGGDVDRIQAALDEHELKVVRIVHTHAHFDHVTGTKELQEATDCETCLHRGDTFLMDIFPDQAKLLGLPLDLGPTPRIDTELEHMQELRFGESASLVLHTPGHTPGSVCFSLKTPDGMLLLSGDTLFRLGVGRTDLPRGSFDELMGSIRDQLFALEDDTRVIPGHGPETSIGFERKQNPFLR